jgi:integrase
MGEERRAIMIVERQKFGSRGQGALVKYAASPNWFSVYYADGREHAESTRTADLKKARAWHRKKLDELASARQGHAPVVTPAMRAVTVSELIDEVFGSPEFKALKSADTVKYHAVAVRAQFGSWRAVNVTAEAWDRYIEARRQAGIADATVNRERAVLQAAFKLGTQRKRLSALQVPKLSRLPEKNIRRGFFERGEFEAVVAHIADYLKDFVRFAYDSGWRLSEIRGLRWNMVDRAAGTITLPDSKNGRGRVLPLTGGLADVVKRREAARLITRGDQVIVTDLMFHRDGKPVGDLRKSWAAACVKAQLFHVEKDDAGKDIKVPDKLFHDFRRTAVRNLVRSGVDPTIAREITGHRTQAVFSRYNIVSETDLRRAMLQRAAYERTLARAERP